MRILSLVMFAVLACFGLHAFADAVVVAPPTFLDGIVAWLQANPALIASIAGILEVVLRVVPSQKALSLLIPAQYVLEKLSLIFSVLAGILKGLISTANNVK